MNAVMLLHIQTNSNCHFTNYLRCQNKEILWIIYRWKNSTNPLILRWSTKAESTVNILVHITILFFEASFPIVRIYHALVASQSSLGVYKIIIFFCFLDKTKQEDALQEDTKHVPNC